ncbi:rhomboid-like protein 20 [Populus alba x Populus x berolinensis]|uniref:Rhomboid-like protein 20 n=1 Tax=Populus alba x Populus x berolinensis TaxID=444605 RepID=A0AAD6QKX8_9ROSI|nr:rhomboid-like protein 20 [Populus alba x Populus x berolinensis]
MNGGPSGFHNAPVTRICVIASAIFSVFLGIKGGSNKLGLSYQEIYFSLLQDIFRNPRLWKLVLSVFAFSSTPEMMFGLYLLYYFRVFERQIGSNKYSVFILFSVIVSLLFEVFAVTLLQGTIDRLGVWGQCPRGMNLNGGHARKFWGLEAGVQIHDPLANLLTSGPYGLIFASFVPFYFDIPVSTRFRVVGVHLSDKSFIYLAGVQLLLSSWKRSILPGICGILAGSLYRLNLFGIRKAKVGLFVSLLPFCK